MARKTEPAKTNEICDIIECVKHLKSDLQERELHHSSGAMDYVIYSLIKDMEEDLSAKTLRDTKE